MKHIKKYENLKDKDYWNKVLHTATWRTDRTHKKIPYDENYIDFDNVKLAIENGADPDSANTLSWAIRMNDFKVVKYMVEHGADINKQHDSGKWTPIMSALSPQKKPINLEMCIFLLDNGADPTISNFQNINALDILSHTKMKDFIPAYPRVSKIEKNKMDIISKHIIDLLEKNPEEAFKYKDYLTSEQKIKFAPYLDVEKYNL